MTTLNVNAANDGYRTSAGSFGGAGQPDVRYGSIGAFYSFYCRFTSVTIPQGYTINSAKLELRYIQGAGTPSGTGKCELALNPAAVVSNADWTSRVLTTAGVTWAPSTSTAGTAVQTTSFAASLQEVVNQGSWASGNAVNVFFNQSVTGTNYHEYAAIGHATYAEPKLVVDYSAPPVYQTLFMGQC